MPMAETTPSDLSVQHQQAFQALYSQQQQQSQQLQQNQVLPGQLPQTMLGSQGLAGQQYPVGLSANPWDFHGASTQQNQYLAQGAPGKMPGQGGLPQLFPGQSSLAGQHQMLGLQPGGDQNRIGSYLGVAGQVPAQLPQPTMQGLQAFGQQQPLSYMAPNLSGMPSVVQQQAPGGTAGTIPGLSSIPAPQLTSQQPPRQHQEPWQPQRVVMPGPQLGRPKEMDNDVLPFDATCSIYVDGLPDDVTKRELQHIFRQYPGLKEVRLTNRPQNRNKPPGLMAFAEYNTKEQTYTAIRGLDNYIMDLFNRESSAILKLSFAKARREEQDRNRHNRHAGGGGGGFRRDSSRGNNRDSRWQDDWREDRRDRDGRRDNDKKRRRPDYEGEYEIVDGVRIPSRPDFSGIADLPQSAGEHKPPKGVCYSWWRGAQCSVKEPSVCSFWQTHGCHLCMATDCCVTKCTKGQGLVVAQ